MQSALSELEFVWCARTHTHKHTLKVFQARDEHKHGCLHLNTLYQQLHDYINITQKVNHTSCAHLTVYTHTR